LALISPGRRTCGTMEQHTRMLEAEPVYRANRLTIERFSLERARVALRAAAPRTITIPVVVHVLHSTAAENISEEQVRSQIAVLNQDFQRKNPDRSQTPAPFRGAIGNPKVRFQLAVRDPNGSPTNGITRTPTTKPQFDSGANDIKFTAQGGRDAWPRDRYLNLWVGGTVVDPVVGALLGYAQFPGGPAATDGVVIAATGFGTQGTAQAPFNKGRTATHEIGHWLNLLHIWGDDNGGCQGSDNVADTPNQAGPNSGCPSFPHRTCQNGPHGDMFMNYMDYTDDACMFMFTKGQVARMRTTLQGPRATILASDALAPAARVARLALPTRAPKASLATLVGAEAGSQVTTVFDGAGWVQVGAR